MARKGAQRRILNIRYRITLALTIQEQVIIPVDVGTHDEVYR